MEWTGVKAINLQAPAAADVRARRTLGKWMETQSHPAGYGQLGALSNSAVQPRRMAAGAANHALHWTGHMHLRSADTRLWQVPAPEAQRSPFFSISRRCGH